MKFLWLGVMGVMGENAEEGTAPGNQRIFPRPAVSPPSPCSLHVTHHVKLRTLSAGSNFGNASDSHEDVYCGASSPPSLTR
jgi:hypothetical protein